MNDNWEYMCNKTKRYPFLGTLDHPRKTLKKCDESVRFSSEFGDRIMALVSLIAAVAFWFLTCRGYPYSKPFGRFFLVFVAVLYSVVAYLFLVHKKRIFGTKGGGKIHFLWGLYPFVKTVSIDSAGVTVSAEAVKDIHRRGNSKREQIYLSRSDTNSKIVILRSRRHEVILSILKEVEIFLKEL